MLRFDDQFPLHRKVDGLTDSAFRMHVEAIFWCARNLTDGFIAQDDISSACRYRKPEGYLAECVKRGAWHRIDDGRITVGCAECAGRYPDLKGDGWLIHGYFDWQLPRTKVLDIREKRKAAGQAGGIKSGQSRRGTKPAAQGRSGSKREAKPKQDAKRSVEPPIPSPSKEGNRGERPASPGAALAPDPASRSPGDVVKPQSAGEHPYDRKALLDQLAAGKAKVRTGENRRNGLAALSAAVAELPPLPDPVRPTEE